MNAVCSKVIFFCMEAAENDSGPTRGFRYNCGNMAVIFYDEQKQTSLKTVYLLATFNSTSPLPIRLHQKLPYRSRTSPLHDHLSYVIDYQQVSCFIFVSSLHAAFDTLDHSTLLHPLSSWFGLSSLSLQ